MHATLSFIFVQVMCFLSLIKRYPCKKHIECQRLCMNTTRKNFSNTKVRNFNRLKHVMQRPSFSSDWSCALFSFHNNPNEWQKNQFSSHNGKWFISTDNFLPYMNVYADMSKTQTKQWNFFVSNFSKQLYVSSVVSIFLSIT
jgi:hypothetical protein